MAGFNSTQPNQIFGGAPATAVLSPNTRVMASSGFVHTSVDVVLLAHGGTGQWVAPNTKSQANGAFMVTQSSQGIALIPATPPVPTPMIVVAGDPKVQSL